MKGQAINETEKLGKRSEWLERGVWFAGGLVVAGLLMEYGPEIGISFARHESPKPATVGGLLVTVGVAAEVVLGIFVAKTAKRLQVIAETTIAETLERAARAEQEAAEANLARVRLEEHIASRDILEEESDRIAESLKLFSGQIAEVDAFPVTFETSGFAFACWKMLIKAGWEVNLLNVSPVSPPTAPRSKTVSTGTLVETTTDEESRAAGTALMKALAEVSGGMGVMTPGSLHDLGQLVRVTVGEKPGIARTRSPRPVTPPQA